MAQSRIAYLDVLRIVACLMVVVLHGPLTYMAAAEPRASYAAFQTVADGTNIFFMISGALLLPVTKPWWAFAERRSLRVLWPLLVWSVVYLVAGCINGTKTPWDALRLEPAAGHLWYLYMAIAIYITLPLVSRCIDAIGERGVKAYLVMWLLSSLIPFWHGIFGEFSLLHNPLSIVYNCYGYVILGYWLRKHPLPLFTWRHGWWIALVLLAGIVGMPLVEFNLQPSLSWLDHLIAVNDNMSVNAVMTSTLVFTVIQRFVPDHYADEQSAVARTTVAVSDCTFGIYLMHILVMEQVGAPLLRPLMRTAVVHPLVLGILLSLLTFVICLVFTLLLRLLPGRKYVVG